LTCFYYDSHAVYRAAPLAALPWLDHGFGTRNPVPWSHDPQLVTLRQVHSDTCIYTDGRAGRIGEGDALLTDKPGLVLAVRTADCLPILLVDEARRAVAIAHAGWRGTLKQLAARAVEAMRTRFSTRPEDLHAAIGPGIGACCYEVGPEVAVQFRALFPERSDLSEKTRIDLAEANRRLLIRTGVPETRLYLAGLCTCCRAAEFHSWCRDGRHAGRMLSAIRILSQ